jgi:hypothetical protein
VLLKLEAILTPVDATKMARQTVTIRGVPGELTSHPMAPDKAKELAKTLDGIFYAYEQWQDQHNQKLSEAEQRQIFFRSDPNDL